MTSFLRKITFLMAGRQTAHRLLAA